VIPYGRQSIDADDIAAVVEVLRGDWLTQGPHIEQFEQGLVEATGARFAVAFSSGTAAIHAAAIATGIGPGDVVATPALTFAASAACALYAGATPRFVDIDPETLNIDLEQVDGDVDCVVAVHYAGLPVDLSRLRRRPRIVIEDAAHALGAQTPDGPVGNCANSDASVFSFHPVKAITTGEGGAVTTNSSHIAERLRLVRNHGMQRRPERGGWYYEISDLGFNFRLTDLQAALGVSQLAKLERFVDRRNELAARYRAALADGPLTLPPVARPPWRHAYHLFPVQVDDRHRVYDQLRSAGVGVQVHYIPVHHHPLYEPFAKPGTLPVTEHVCARLLSLPLFPALGDQDLTYVTETLTRICAAESQQMT
jgi:UDP-4-amino-4,6-dideoxy-N-acetyl-beta-L-altrosamine transaminase